jgi:predicted nuclease of predicted toxin-antitoxin system
LALKFLIDESTGKKIAHALLSFNVDCVSMIDIAPGTKDIDVLNIAVKEERILMKKGCE